MAEKFKYYSQEEFRQLQDDFKSGNLDYNLELNACKWFFPYMMKFIANSPKKFSRNKLIFNIYVDVECEVSSLQYLAVFLRFRRNMNSNSNDKVILHMPNSFDFRIYNKISRYLFLVAYGTDNFKDQIRIKHSAGLQRLASTEHGGFGNTGIPLFPITPDLYMLLQENAFEFVREVSAADATDKKQWKKIADFLSASHYNIKYTSLSSVIIRETCRNFMEELENRLKLLNNECRSFLETANVLTFLFFGSAIYAIYNEKDGKMTKNLRDKVFDDNTLFVTVFERCSSYSTGILQLIENTLSHADGGYFSIRTFWREDDALKSLLADPDENKDDFLRVFVCDIAKPPYDDMLTVFVNNLKNREPDETQRTPSTQKVIDAYKDGTVAIHDMFFPNGDSVVLQYLSNPQNIGYHYGLQIFASAVEGARGDFRVVSGNRETTKNSHLAERTDGKYSSEIRKKYITSNKESNSDDIYFCGTKYDILLPVSEIAVAKLNPTLESPIPSELTFEAVSSKIELKKINCNKYIDRIDDLLWDIRKDNEKHSSFWTIKKQLVEELAEEIEEQNDIDVASVNLEIDPGKRYGFSFNLFLEVLSKATFSVMSQESKLALKNIMLGGFPDSGGMMLFVRYYSQFYDRFGYNISSAVRSQIVLAANQCESTRYITLSGRYIGEPLYDYIFFSGGRTNRGPENALIRQSLQQIGIRTKDNTLNKIDIHCKNNPHHFDNIKIKYKHKEKERWIVDLEHAIGTNFSDPSCFGSAISNCVTHMHISGVHLDRFFQIDQIFTNAYWSKKLGEWLVSIVGRTDKPIIFFGYERLTEPMLIQAQKNLFKDEIDCHYIIYDEAYHYSAEEVAPPSLAFHGKNDEIKAAIRNDAPIIFIMPISTTMGTFKRMAKLLWSCMNNGSNETFEFSSEKTQFVAVLQLKETECDNDSRKIRERYIERFEDGVAIMKNPLLDEKCGACKEGKESFKQCKYLLTLGARWQDAEKCDYCYPVSVNGYERMLYTTDDTSFIPTMQLRVFSTPNEQADTSDETLNFFEKNENGEYIYADCLVYKHVRRQDAHFTHYIRTEELLAKILENKNFYDYAYKIKYKLCPYPNTDTIINVIIAPSHVSNQMFPVMINDVVFNGLAHIISINVKKIYRSNFAAEFSNYRSLVHALQNRIAHINSTRSSGDRVSLSDFVRFHFVDDHINTSSAYVRAKSLLKDIFNTGIPDMNIKFDGFYSIITLIDRHSMSSRRDYIEDPTKFFCFFKFDVPGTRSNGDSCHLCKQVDTDKKLELCAALDSTAKICVERRDAHSVLEISSAIEKSERQRNEKPELFKVLLTRHMRRYEAENILWKTVRETENIKYTSEDSEGYSFISALHESIIRVVSNTLQKNAKTDEEKLEYLIAFFKVLPRPFLSYRPFVATVAIDLLRSACDSILDIDGKYKKDGNIIVRINLQAKEFSPDKTQSNENAAAVKADILLGKDAVERKKQVENLLLVCISGLASLNSTYLTNTENLRKILRFHTSLDFTDKGIFDYHPDQENDQENKQEFVRSFADYVRFAVFRIVHHEKFGSSKRSNFDKELVKILKDQTKCNRDDVAFFSLLYLENSEHSKQSNEDAPFSQAINSLHKEIKDYDYMGTKDLKDNNAGILAKSVLYIDESEVGESETAKRKSKPHVDLTPLTSRGFFDAFNVGFDIHFGNPASANHFPIVKAINPFTQQLWGKIRLDEKSERNLFHFGISTLCNSCEDNAGCKAAYIFLKFSNAKKLDVQQSETGPGYTIPVMPSIYLRIERPAGNLLDMLEIIRPIALHRHQILKKFKDDFTTDNVNRMLEERRYHRSLSISKAAKHATDESERIYPILLGLEDCNRKLAGRVRRLIANRTVSGLYLIESSFFEKENNGEEGNPSDESEIIMMRSSKLWYEEYTDNPDTYEWTKLKEGFIIDGKPELNRACEIRLRFNIDPSVIPSTYENYLGYSMFSCEKLTLDFIYLLANNAIRHYLGAAPDEVLPFTISQEGEFLSLTSCSGHTEEGIGSLINRTVRAMVIPPHVRKYLRDNQEGKPIDTDGVTLWTLSRYFRRLEMHRCKRENIEYNGIIMPVYVDNLIATGGYEYFNVTFLKGSDGKTYFTVKFKCLNAEEVDRNDRNE